jgi:hypothetical protein
MRKIALLFILAINTTYLFGQDVYKVVFIADVTQYYSALVLFDDGSGKMRTKFYDPNCECPVMVEQTMKIENTNSGLRLMGYNPVYPGTYNRYPTYSADNFYISRDYKGNLNITDIDDYGVTASASIVSITAYSQKKEFLSEFNWQLN